MVALGLPVNNGNMAAKFGGIVSTPAGGIKVTPALAAAVSADTGKNITPTAIAQVLQVSANQQIDPGSNITSMVNSIDTSDVGNAGGFSDVVSGLNGKLNSLFVDMFGADNANVAEYGFWGLLAAGAVYVGRKFFHSKTGLIRPKF